MSDEPTKSTPPSNATPVPPRVQLSKDSPAPTVRPPAGAPAEASRSTTAKPTAPGSAARSAPQPQPQSGGARPGQPVPLSKPATTPAVPGAIRLTKPTLQPVAKPAPAAVAPAKAPTRVIAGPRSPAPAPATPATMREATIPTSAIHSDQGDEYSQTMRIAVPEAAGGPPTSTIKLVPPPGGASVKPTQPIEDAPESVQEAEDAFPAFGDSSQTMHINMQEIGIGPKPVPTPTPIAALADSPKRKTSKIPLEAAMGGESVFAESAGPKTIRIKPTLRAARPGATTPSFTPPAPTPAAAAMTPEQMLTDKRKTSRISLESALISQEAPTQRAHAVEPSSGGPRTIRLKRPTEPGALRVSESVPAPVMTRVEDAPSAEPAAEAFSKTTRLETPAPEEETSGPSATKRKTIRVKQPTQRPGVTSVSVRRPAAVTAAGGGAALATAPVIADEPNWIFPTLAILSIFVTGFVIYMFMAQATGPNLSCTELSCAKDWASLSFPMKIMQPPQ